MAFQTKEWKDRISQYANRRKLTDVSNDTTQTVVVSRDEGTITQEGDAFSAENMNGLESRIFTAFSEIATQINNAINSLARVATTGSYTDLSNRPTIPAAVAVKGNAETNYRTGNVNLKPADIGASALGHAHGNIQNGGTLQSSDITIANGDKLVVTDSSDSSKVARTSIAFDGSTTTQYLSKKGTWQSIPTQAGNFRGIDAGNVLATYTNNFTYKATEDCWLVGTLRKAVGDDELTIKIRNSTSGTYKQINGDTYGVAASNTYFYILLPLKKNNQVEVKNGVVNVNVFGVSQ